MIERYMDQGTREDAIGRCIHQDLPWLPWEMIGACEQRNMLVATMKNDGKVGNNHEKVGLTMTNSGIIHGTWGLIVEKWD